MKTTRAWYIYTVVRLLAILVPFALVMLLFPNWQWNWLLGIVVGTVVGVTVSVIFLRSERMAIGDAIMHRREASKQGKDALAEDALLDKQDAEPGDSGS